MPRVRAALPRRRFRAGAAITVLTLLLAMATPLQAAHYRLVGYVTPKTDTATIEAGRLTALNAAFAHIENGEVVVPPATDSLLARLRSLRSHQPALKLILSIGGWSAGGFSEAAATPATRRRLIDSVIAVVRSRQLDGVDLDWEYPGHHESGIVSSAGDGPHFTALLAGLRQALDRAEPDRHLLLTAALADGPFVDHVELGKVQRLLDWINLMSYDFHNSLTPTTGHHAGLFRSRASHDPADRTVQAAVAQYERAGVPAAKIVVGVPFYGRAFGEVDPAEHGLYQHYGRFVATYDWKELQQRVNRQGFRRYWDQAACAPWLWNARERVFISYEDPESLRARARFVRDHGLGGMMYWEQSEDPDNQLFDVLADGLDRAVH